MPAKNIIKTYQKNGYYHLYNRGVENRNIFLDKEDYETFLNFIKRYLVEPSLGPGQVGPPRRSDLYEKLNLIAYCLMPNHFHFLVKQFTKKAIIEFMRSLSNSYVYFFNNKYKRVGPLFQGRYKGILIKEDSYLLHLSRYIHLNPLELGEVRPPDRSDLLDYAYSSYGDYLGKRKTKWVKPEEILSFFKKIKKSEPKNRLSYQSFVEDYKENPKEKIKKIAID